MSLNLTHHVVIQKHGTAYENSLSDILADTHRTSFEGLKVYEVYYSGILRPKFESRHLQEIKFENG